MGASYKAICECGFNKTARVGGSMSNYLTESTFPFYCEKCGLVNLNICTKDIECSHCKSTDIVPYGDERVSKDNRFKMVQWGDYAAPSSGNLCPQCKKFSLEFKMNFMFD